MEPETEFDAELENRRAFLLSQGVWSGAVVATALIASLDEAEAGDSVYRTFPSGYWSNWVGDVTGSGGWYNSRAAATTPAWVNRPVYRGKWVNSKSDARWFNNRTDDKKAGGWVNSGSWVNSRPSSGSGAKKGG